MPLARYRQQQGAAEVFQGAPVLRRQVGEQAAGVLDQQQGQPPALLRGGRLLRIEQGRHLPIQGMQQAVHHAAGAEFRDRRTARAVGQRRVLAEAALGVGKAAQGA